MDSELRESAIPKDLLETPIAKVSAGDFLKALGIAMGTETGNPPHPPVPMGTGSGNPPFATIGQPVLGIVLAEKKKTELELQNPDWDKEISVGQLLDKVRGEKKKAELELLHEAGQLINPPMIEQLADAIAQRINR